MGPKKTFPGLDAQRGPSILPGTMQRGRKQHHNTAPNSPHYGDEYFECTGKKNRNDMLKQDPTWLLALRMSQ